MMVNKFFWLGALCLILLLFISEASLGVVYHPENGKLLDPGKLAQLLISRQIQKVRLYNVDLGILKFFGNTSIEVIVSAQNSEVAYLGESKYTAFNWVKRNIIPYILGTNITGICMGEEILTRDPTAALHLVGACENVYNALALYGLESQIKISSPQSMLILESILPPSGARFKPIYLNSVVVPFLSFLARTGSYFMVNIYDIYEDEGAMTEEVNVEFALMEPTSAGFADKGSGLFYLTMFDASVDAVYSAMAALRPGERDIEIVVAETRWPQKLLGNQTVDFVRNAATYNRNLLNRFASGVGTPLKPDMGIRAYLRERFRDDEVLTGWSNGSSSSSSPAVENVTNSELYGINDTVIIRVMERTWCVANPWAPIDALDAALNWACGPGGAYCLFIQLGQSCFVPNTLLSHASYAFNSYYQMNLHGPGTCDFGGTAVIVDEEPSYPGCFYPFRSGQVGAPTGGSMMIRPWYNWPHLFTPLFLLLLLPPLLNWI